MEPEERRELILTGAIEPIRVTATLQRNEKAYISVAAKRTAIIDEMVEQTKGGSKRKGVLTRGIVGGVITAPLGIGIIGGIVGAATAGSKTHSKTTQKKVSKFQIVDTGELIFTNKRMLFVGNKEILSVDYDELIDTKFGRNLLGRTFSPRYQEMLPHETFVMSGPAAAEADIFYEGITQNLIK